MERSTFNDTLTLNLIKFSNLRIYGSTGMIRSIEIFAIKIALDSLKRRKSMLFVQISKLLSANCQRESHACYSKTCENLVFSTLLPATQSHMSFPNFDIKNSSRLVREKMFNDIFLRMVTNNQKTCSHKTIMK